MSEPAPVPLSEQIAEVRREIALRARLYPGWTQARRMTPAEANAQLAAMSAVLTSLDKCKQIALIVRSVRACDCCPEFETVYCPTCAERLREIVNLITPSGESKSHDAQATKGPDVPV